MSDFLTYDFPVFLYSFVKIVAAWLILSVTFCILFFGGSRNKNHPL